ncbi:hypothetical protein NSQ54_08330 [Alkalihalobacillus sp. FSL W8-0930]
MLEVMIHYGKSGFNGVITVYFFIYIAISFPVIYLIYKMAKDKIYLFAPPVILFVLYFVMEANGRSKFAKYTDELSRYGEVPDTMSGHGSTLLLFAFLISPLILTTLVWSIFFFIMSKRKKNERLL